MNPTQMTELLGEPREFRLGRTGDLDLLIFGWRVCETAPSDSGRSAVGVSLYLTATGKYVGHICRYLPETERFQAKWKWKAATFDTAPELLVWLREDGRGHLGENAKQAWEDFTSRLPGLKQLATERIT